MTPSLSAITCPNTTSAQDSENNTILMILADQRPSPVDPYTLHSAQVDISGACLRMARLYYDRYPEILDWSNMQGKTALHIASLKGNEELVRVCTKFQWHSIHLLTLRPPRCFVTLGPTMISLTTKETLRYISEYQRFDFGAVCSTITIVPARGVIYL